MNYTFEELKKQIISLDFSKTNEIKDLELSSLIKYAEIEITKTDNIINEELIKLGNKNIEKFNDLYYIDEPIKLNSLIIISNLHILLLKRIKVDLLNL
ncbi:conserved hypothetical protein [Flavobacterium psychrophilum]|uniref:hypothetical protein n=1 Tax=Flavobacterium psychrophilum TaxID=96345 RepID=UPI000B7C09B1|nr:hypothetical protein [Flavobacterium psychrophilum]SNB43031.1 conserved hypothetical protein [Flavobacterium psychrophilum]